MTDIRGDSAVFVMDDYHVVVDKHDAEGFKHITVDEKYQIGNNINAYGKEHPYHHNNGVRAPHFVQPLGKKHGKNVITPRHDASHSLVDSMETVTLSWENVNVEVKPKNRPCFRGPDPSVVQKRVLRDVYGHVKPGTLLAIMGASGSGKTTLLNTLTSRINSESLSAAGDIKVNGIDVGAGIRNISAYVQQDDLFIATMTVREHLTFRALLRMEQEVSRARRLERVDEVIQELGLQKCQDNIIGNPGRIKGISGGEMRRLSFASESSVLLMAEGRVAFLGDSAGALNFFKEAGYPCPVNYNPADFYIMTMAVVPGNETECKTKIEAICDKFDDTPNAKSVLAENKRVAENPKRTGIIYEEAFSSTSRYEASWLRQFAAVFERSWKTTVREPMVARVRFVQTILLSIVLGLIYLQLDVDQRGVMDINGVLFLMITNMTFTNVFGVLNSFPLETPIFLREYGVGLYRVDVYFLSKCLAELPSFIIIPLIFCAITYWMIGLYATFEAFLVFTGVMLLVANISVSFGYIVSAAANSVTTALAFAPPMMIPLLMFGGFFLNSDSIPVYFIWLEYLSWFKYANELLSVNQWDNIDSIDCENSTSSGSQSLCLYKSGEQVINYLNFDKDNLWLDVGCLFAMLVAYRLVAYIILLIKARKSKQ
ncbi:protein white-like [Ruditapes philippinarum]|uniref:protein white-like n=1 Tax=Ruditapes philippinarum TaxID=129788 RepID=UPI00295C1709|nr:protein white-like [Ruditapes philippinarum]